MLRGRILIVTILWFLVAFTPAGAQPPAQEGSPGFQARITADEVMAHVRALVTLGARPLGSRAEERAAEYAAAALTSYGYDVQIQPFQTTPLDWIGDVAPYLVTSRNVIATKPGGPTMVVIGAHIDSVAVGEGAGDNASGVAAMLAAARAVADLEMAHTVAFIGFGANEGCCPTGSDVYIDRLGDGIDNVVAMLNIDAVGVGAELNVYAGAQVVWGETDGSQPLAVYDGPTWVRDLALDLAAAMSLPFGTTPPETWNGFTGSWGDHFGFAALEIPVAYFEAWRWQGEGVTDPWWGVETAEGDVLHTEADVYERVNPQYVEMTAELVAVTVYAIANRELPMH